ncbi:MAG: hypothetical protein JWN30_237 [Bacilli bacterium]|nr:hypothetical protein [Bacilli bacterium]
MNTANAKSSSKFVRGAFQLLGSTILIKLIGVFFVIPLERIVGLSGMGIYNSAYPIYATMLQISAVGIPLALSKLVAERLSSGDRTGAFALYSTGSRLLSITGIVAFLLMFFGAPVIAALQHNPDSTLSIMALAPALLVVTRLGAMRGLLQGFQHMGHSSVSQVWEQLVRVFTIVVLSWAIMHFTHGKSLTLAVAGATFGAVTGALSAWISLKYSLHRLDIGRREQLPKPSQRLVKLIIATSVPLSLASLVLPLSQAVDSFSIIRLLEFGGVAHEAALKLFAIFSSATRVMNLPLAFATAIGLPIVPAIARAIARKERSAVHEQVNLAMRFTTILTFPAAAAFIVLSQPIARMFNQTTTEHQVYALVSLMAIFAAIEMTTTYILQATGKLLRPVRNMMIGMLVKLVMNIVLIPQMGVFGIRGAAIATITGYLASSVLNLLAVRRYTGTTLNWTMIFVRPFFTCLPMMGVMYVVYYVLQDLFAPFLKSGIAMYSMIGVVGLVGGYMYLMLARVFGVLSRTEIQRIAIVNRLLPRALRVSLDPPASQYNR